MATNTYVALDKVTVGTATPSVTFTGISQAYTDLVVVISAQRGISGSGGDGSVQLNSDTGSNYSTTLLYTDGNTPYSFRWSNQTAMLGAFSAADSTYGVSTVHFMNYSNTTTYKTVVSRYGWPGTNSRVAAGANLWRSTAAITSITFAASNNIAAGSTFSLYAIKAE